MKAKYKAPKGWTLVHDFMKGWCIIHNEKDITISCHEVSLRKVDGAVSRWWFLVRRAAKKAVARHKRKNYRVPDFSKPIITPVITNGMKYNPEAYKLSSMRSIILENPIKETTPENYPRFIQSIDYVASKPKKKSWFS